MRLNNGATPLASLDDLLIENGVVWLVCFLISRPRSSLVTGQRAVSLPADRLDPPACMSVFL